MALDFPANPTLHQVFQNWIWDGTKWVIYTGAPGSGGGFPPGTVTVFYQNTAPVGWTEVATQNDKLLRVVNTTTGGTAGGTTAFSTVNAQAVTGTYALAGTDLPTISASGNVTVYPNSNSGYYVPIVPGANFGMATYAIGGSGGQGAYPTSAGLGGLANGYYMQSGSVSLPANNTGGAGHTHPISLNIAYCDFMLASKN